MNNHSIKLFALLRIYPTLLVIVFANLAASQQQQQQFKACQNAIDCPENSLCTNANEIPICICLQGYELDPVWLSSNSTAEKEEHYCRRRNETQIAEEKNKLLVYIQSPARKEHLAFAILMVLLGASLALAVIYAIQALRPLKRTKNAYIKLKRRRENRHILLELDEHESIGMKASSTKQDSNAQLFA